MMNWLTSSSLKEGVRVPPVWICWMSADIYHGVSDRSKADLFRLSLNVQPLEGGLIRTAGRLHPSHNSIKQHFPTSFSSPQSLEPQIHMTGLHLFWESFLTLQPSAPVWEAFHVIPGLGNLLGILRRNTWSFTWSGNLKSEEPLWRRIYWLSRGGKKYLSGSAKTLSRWRNGTTVWCPDDFILLLCAQSHRQTKTQIKNLNANFNITN